MKCNTVLSALTQVEYLEQKMLTIHSEIKNGCNMPSSKQKELFFQLGKTYSELELMRRVAPYD